MRHVVFVALTLAAAASAGARQAEAPKLSRTERSTLQAIVAAADAAGTIAPLPETQWPIHLLRASDGSHYVAFTVPAPETAGAKQLIAYVRLASRRDPRVASGEERSAVAAWLAGERGTPNPPRRGIAFGEMPTFGPGAVAGRGPGPQSLQLLEMQRERDRERREARERDRKAELEGTTAARTTNALLPFEDFDLHAVPVALDDGRTVLRRSLTAGPGLYDLVVAWGDAGAKSPASSIGVVKRTLDLPPAMTSEFALSSVIIADDIRLRDVPFPAEQQSANPYSIAGTDIRPAADAVLSNDDRLAVAAQVINARPAATGKPDVVVGFRLLRATDKGEESLGAIAPQFYNQTTLPVDFDVSRGHPLFAAIAIPLRTFKRGAYRLQVMADDRHAGVSATAETRFTVIGTPATLLRDAPPVAPRFARESLLAPPVLSALVAGITPAAASPEVLRAATAAREGRFVDVIRELSAAPASDVVATMLRAVALYGLGDTATAVCTPLRQITPELASPVRVVLGACRAIDGSDRDAIDAWQAARAAGTFPSALTQVLAGAYLRAGDHASAIQLLRDAPSNNTPGAGNEPLLAAALIAANREEDALALLQSSADTSAQWLTLHALFALHVRTPGGLTAAQRDRFMTVADAYVGARGAHAALAQEWTAALAPRE